MYYVTLNPHCHGFDKNKYSFTNRSSNEIENINKYEDQQVFHRQDKMKFSTVWVTKKLL